MMIKEEENICRMCGGVADKYTGATLKLEDSCENQTQTCCPCHNELNVICSLFHKIAKQEDFLLRQEQVNKCITEWIEYSSIPRRIKRNKILRLQEKIILLSAKLKALDV